MSQMKLGGWDSLWLLVLIYIWWRRSGFNNFLQELIQHFQSRLHCAKGKMVATIATSKASCHARLISLPSGSHPLTASVEENLCRLKASEATSSCSPSSICHNLGLLNDLYEHFNDFLQLPLTQQSLSCNRHGKWVEEVLGRSLGLLDICGTSKDALWLMKECVQELESSLRRRKGGELGPANGVQNFTISRGNVTKMVHKCFGNLKKMEKVSNSAVLDEDRDLVAFIKMLREVEAASVSVFESLLSFVSGTKAKSKPKGWSLVSELMPLKQVACEVEEVATIEVEKIDVALHALNRQKSSKNIVVQVQNVQKRLEAFELSIQELEDTLECLFRCLVKTRVSLLNILNH